MKATDFDKYLDTQLKNPGFRRAYEDLEEEYELAKQIIRFRIDRLESGNHTNLTLGFLSRLAKALDLRAELKFLPLKPARMASSGGRRKGSRTSASARTL